MQEKTKFSSSALGAALDEKSRYALWQEIHNDQIWSVDYSVGESVPFQAEIEAFGVGQLVVGKMSGSIKRASRQATNVSADGRDGYLLLINKSGFELRGSQVGRDYGIGLDSGALVSASEPLVMAGNDTNSWMNIVIPAKVMTDSFASVEDMLARPIAADNEALKLLIRYCQFLEEGPVLASQDIIAHATNTILDLIGLAAGARGSAVELAGVRGMRAARLAAILGRIDADFANPRISAPSVAEALGVSVRYVHDILMETGLGFSERVLELRLQKAKRMLAGGRHTHLRISDIALAVGFGDISYFNRSFRRRFGATPTSVR
ncbi:helix-turn-helix domain-containing protein [Mesorhizobium sp. NBSH29]|uniref:AraC family transcriptional regulator n=1 Tax=Mesorhizobium sp. NBSH29 TaxID=2654249 RepID=UPI0018967586|nr:AraC family transcriptional regulator [Mesorhizobium sp. NBSH29]QPC86955.1 helix-turn-helix domain-containing protein [Mesorhizobium sp. NBSH29]